MLRKTMERVLGRTPVKEPEKEPECPHDWAAVDEYHPRDLFDLIMGVENITEGERNEWGGHFNSKIPILRFDFQCPDGTLLQSGEFYVDNFIVRDKVCLICGDCHTGRKDFFDHITNTIRWKIQHDQDMAERKALANKMWEEGCKNDR
jgi:hypothetical protein